MEPLVLHSFTVASSLGAGLNATLGALAEQRSGLLPCTFEHVNLNTYVGQVAGLEQLPVRDDLAEFDCRNHRLAQRGLRQDGFADAVAAVKEQYGPARIAVLLGTSTSGILETELAYQRRNPATGALPSDFRYASTHNHFALPQFVQRYFGLCGPALAVSTACSSSAKVFGSAARMIAAGLCDAAIVGGVDSLCLTTLYGFNSLELVSPESCRPFDAQRGGISIGEAAGFALLKKAPAIRAPEQLLLLGVGESSDAYHMSTPHPEGLGAQLAMRRALQAATLQPADIDYINLHGTATRSNDAAEDCAVYAVFGGKTACSSTKGYTGHTLGAAGIIEAIICALSLRHGFMPGTLNCQTPDPVLRCKLLLANERRPLRRVLSNSFGFGGNNCSLIFGRGD